MLVRCVARLQSTPKRWQIATSRVGQLGYLLQQLIRRSPVPSFFIAQYGNHKDHLIIVNRSTILRSLFLLNSGISALGRVISISRNSELSKRDINTNFVGFDDLPSLFALGWTQVQ